MKGLTAVITGASGGIGLAISKALAKEGVNLVLFGGTNAKKLEDTAAFLKKEFKDIAVDFYPCDLTDDKSVIGFFKKAAKNGVDILINNAGQAFSAPVEDTDMRVFDKIMDLNFRAPVLITKQALPYLKASKRPTIINIASVVAHNGYPLQSAYTASKHALLGFSKSIAAELYNQGIRVHVISPGGVYTDMIKTARPDLTGEDMIMPEDIAETVLFLLKNRTNAVIDEIRLHRAAKEPFA
nr:SDR family oxidoreductase [Clostridia bacterium]